MLYCNSQNITSLIGNQTFLYELIINELLDMKLDKLSFKSTIQVIVCSLNFYQVWRCIGIFGDSSWEISDRYTVPTSMFLGLAQHRQYTDARAFHSLSGWPSFRIIIFHNVLHSIRKGSSLHLHFHLLHTCPRCFVLPLRIDFSIKVVRLLCNNT